MKYEIEVTDYSPQTGIRWELEDDHTVSTRFSYNEVVIKANHEGLISLARLFLTLAQPGTPPGSHVHVDEGNLLEDGSIRLIVERE